MKFGLVDAPPAWYRRRRRCPACGENGVPLFEYVRALPSRPARCRLCGALAYRHQGVEWAMQALGSLWPVAVVAAAVEFRSWWVAVGAVASLIAIGLVLFASPAVATTPERAASARRWRRVLVPVLLAAVVPAIVLGLR